MDGTDLNEKTLLQSLKKKLQEAEAELRRLRAKHERSERVLDAIRTTFSHLPVAFSVVAGDGTVVYVNEAAKSTAGGALAEGRAYAGALAGSGGGPDEPNFLAALEDGTIHRGRIHFGNGVTCDCVSKRIDLSDGRKAVINLYLEPTEEPASIKENDLRAAKLAALGEIVSDVAHELNNPLTGVIGFSELLAQNVFDEKTSQTIHKILTEANRCKRIVANLLSFSRKHPAQRTRININDLIQETLDLKRYEFHVSNVALKFCIDSNLPETMGDPYLLQQVFFNIVNNAHQAMKKQSGGGTLSITTTTESDRIRICFADTGPGISPEHRQKIFEPFFTTKSEQEGTGLGLSLAHKIIRKHGGTLFVEDTPGGGATFVLTLPIVSASPTPVRRAETASADVSAPVKGKVLIVDDEQGILELVSEILIAKEHKVTVSRNANEALRLISESHFDCIITDVKMPDIDGRELFSLITALRPELSRRLVFITGDYFNESTRKFAEEAGIPLVQKPFGAREIIHVTNSVLANHAYPTRDDSANTS